MMSKLFIIFYILICLGLGFGFLILGFLFGVGLRIIL